MLVKKDGNRYGADKGLHMSLSALIDDFSLFDDWEDKYRFIIELGQSLAPLTEAEHSDAYKVPGCVSQVWIVTENRDGRLHFRGDSDAHIVRGLIAILLKIYNDKNPADILTLDPVEIFTQLDLKDHLTPQRSNGFAAMVQRIRSEAEAASSD